MRRTLFRSLSVPSLLGAVVVVLMSSPGASPSDQSTRKPASGASFAYSWPVKPFWAQHLIRGQFGDPRINLTRSRTTVRSIHFGVDVVATDGTPVFAAVSGRAIVHPGKVYVVTVTGRVLEYWHIVPSVHDGARVVARSSVLGRVAPGRGHVHVAESINGRFFNPLRQKGGMTPYNDYTTPIVANLAVLAQSNRLAKGRAEGVVDLVVEAYDLPALPLPRPFDNYVMTPASLRWRMSSPRRAPVLPWATALDLSTAFPNVGYGQSGFEDVYAWKTRQNEHRPGCYRFYLVRDLDTRTLANGLYLVEIEARDSGGNRGFLRVTIRVVNRLANHHMALAVAAER